METLRINDIQKSYYKKMEEERFDVYFKLYNQISKDIRAKKQISILDVGGGSGVFAKFIEKQQKGVKIVVIDTVKYDTWDTKDKNIDYRVCDAIEVDKVFEENSFDYIFCNMFVHHLIGKNYRDSARIREKVFNNLRKILKPDGKIIISDNLNEGLLFDSASCRMIFALTSCHNSVLKKIFYRLGAHSAGSGVCMMSEKMWIDLLEHSGLRLSKKDISEADKWGLVKKIVLMNKGYKQKCILVAEKT